MAKNTMGTKLPRKLEQRMEIVGELSYESLRGSDSYGFKFDDNWLIKYGSLILSDDLNNYPGYQYTKPEKDIFGCFSDALPDRWGRTILLILLKNLLELFRRVAYNICIANSDDHFRNHGFLLTKKGWTLSPAYDMNPTQNEYQSLLITNSSSKANLKTLLKACEDYMIKKEVAQQIINEVVDAVNDWKVLANKLVIANREKEIFGKIFETRVKQFSDAR